MIIKRLLRPDRVRQVPESFSWVDHRLVRQNCLARCDCHAWALYFFITVVGDVQGLSFYCDASIGRHLKLNLAQVAAARQQLLAAGLIAYQKPIYQVLALPQAPGASRPIFRPRIEAHSPNAWATFFVACSPEVPHDRLCHVLPIAFALG